MSSSPSNRLQAARTALDRLQRQAYQELSTPIPAHDTAFDREGYRSYLSTNPDISPTKMAEALAEFDRSASFSENVIDLSSPATRSILNARVRELEAAIRGFDEQRRLASTCYGTIPGGGL